MVLKEETCVVTLCQLLNRGAIEQAKAIFAEPEKHVSSVNGYIRGARFIPSKILINPLLKLLLNPDLNTHSQRLIVDSLKNMDLQNLREIMSPLIRSLKIPEIDRNLKTEIAEILSKYGDSALFQPILDLSNSDDAFVRKTGIRTLRQLAKREKNIPMDILTNRLYLLLEDKMKNIQIEALLALLTLGDDYAIQILEDYIHSNDEAAIVEILTNLEKPVSHEVLSLLIKLIYTESKMVHQELRSVLPEFCQGSFSEEIRKTLLDSLKEKQEIAAGVKDLDKPLSEMFHAQTDDLIEHAKLEFKFRRENSQILTVFFIDIVGFTEKSSKADTSTLMKLIQGFEKITLPTIAGLKGAVVKKSGDGLLATFKHPLNASLAALTIHKKIQEYNIASRMETSANPGDTLLTQSTYEEIKEYIRCTRLGDIQVKGKNEAITTYSAEEILVDIDQILSESREISAGSSETGETGAIAKLKESVFNPEFLIPGDTRIDERIANELESLFNDMAKAVEDIARDYHEEYIFKLYLQDKWNEMMAIGGRVTV